MCKHKTINVNCNLSNFTLIVHNFQGKFGIRTATKV